MKIALAQINPIVGDLAGNRQKIIDFAHRAHGQGAALVIFPELAVTGYPPQDLLESRLFLDAVEQTLDDIAGAVPAELGVLIGAPVRNEASMGKRLFNAALFYEGGKQLAVVKKQLLPTYDVFDENRYFEPADTCAPFSWRGYKFGIHVCEDMWNNEEQVPYHLYDENPIDALAAQGADLFINISASPFYTGKHAVRNRLIAENCLEHSLPFVYVNQVGANTEIVFDGDSRVHDAAGNLLLNAPSFEEALLVWDMEAAHAPESSDTNTASPDIAQLHDALVMGIRDYFEKTGAFSKALIGLSGGIDSAVTCALAVNALGADRVVGVTMPSRYSSSGSVDDSVALAEAYEIAFHNIAIVPAVAAFDEMLTGVFADTKPGVAEENIQARTRGVTLMALSNKFNHLLLTTGNKSEMSVGYATLYGDMNGGLAVLADVFKMQVFALAEYINEAAGREMIPRNTITKPPSAELRPDQKDEDSLPPYPVLDEVLRLYIEEQMDLDQIVEATGWETDFVHDLLKKVDRNEYKRRQAPPGLRVSKKAFGVGRRLPIVMRWNRPNAVATETARS
ncbi:MAG: NAD+ synthase [Bacteroidota bacterium]